MRSTASFDVYRGARLPHVRRLLFLLMLVLALVAAACADDDADDAAPDDDDDAAAEEADPDEDAPDDEAEEEEEVVQADFINNVSAPLVGLTADQQGFFGDAGIEVEFAELETGTEAIAAMLGGSADFVTAADARLIQAVDQDLEIVAIGIHNSGFLGSLSVRADNDDVEDMEDLVGQRVGVQVGSGVHTAWLRYLDHVGLDEADFDVTNMAVADMPAALEGDSIDGALMWHPHAARGEIEGISRLVMPSHEFSEPLEMVYPFYLITTEELVAEDPDKVQRFVQGWTCAQNWIGENPTEAIDIMEPAFEGVEREVVEAIFEERRYDVYQLMDEVVLADTNAQAQQLVDVGELGDVPDLESAIDNSFVEQALEEGC